MERVGCHDGGEWFRLWGHRHVAKDRAHCVVFDLVCCNLACTLLLCSTDEEVSEQLKGHECFLSLLAKIGTSPIL